MCLNFVTSEPYEIFLTPKVFQTTVCQILAFWLDAFQIPTIFLQSLQQIFVFFHLNLHICHSWLTMLKITILISKDYDIDIYKISRYIAKTVVLLSPSGHQPI